jgi:hypothetical protein
LEELHPKSEQTPASPLGRTLVALDPNELLLPTIKHMLGGSTLEIFAGFLGSTPTPTINPSPDLKSPEMRTSSLAKVAVNGSRMTRVPEREPDKSGRFR